jgi:hypothetical protein
MAEKHLHIVSFDIPYPANYGGVIDVYGRIKYLSDYGIKVHLHCFEYSRNHVHPKELDDICYSVDYYDRAEGVLKMFSVLPYIVATRHSQKLVENLLQDDYPIFLEGLHCCMLLKEPRLKGRKIYVRMHNIEHDYYKSLSLVEKSVIKRMYLKMEVPRLRRFEKILSQATGVFAITRKDECYLAERCSNVHFLPPSLQNEKVISKEGRGSYALFHGQLSVAENYDAVKYLVENVFSHTSITFKVAGLNPPAHLEKFLSDYANVELIKNPSAEEMEYLVANAHVNVLYTKQSTGLKLKLLNSLFYGRYCVANDLMVEGSGLEELCLIFKDSKDLLSKLEKMFTLDFDRSMIEQRATFFASSYSNSQTCKTLVENIYTDDTSYK